MSNTFAEIVKDKSDGELLEMVYQFEMWDKQMLKAVENELSNRSKLPENFLNQKTQLIAFEEEKLIAGKKASFAIQLFGWIGVLGLFGLIIGYQLSHSKTRSKFSHKKYYTYDADSRDNGSYIFFISCTSFILSIIFFVVKSV